MNEAPLAILIVSRAGKNLDRDRAAEPGIDCLVDHTHATGPKLGFDAIRAERSADHDLPIMCAALKEQPEMTPPQEYGVRTRMRRNPLNGFIVFR